MGCSRSPLMGAVYLQPVDDAIAKTGLGRRTVAGCVERMNRLYEQGANSLRIGQYVRRRLCWASCGLQRHATRVCDVDDGETLALPVQLQRKAPGPACWALGSAL